jgi:2-keto-4-pentenoate hydratase
VFASSMTVTIDGEVAGTARPIDVLDGPLGSVTFLVRHLVQHGLDVPAGLWVSCGAVTGVHRIAVGSHAEATMAGVSVACSITRQATSATMGDNA